MKGGGGALLLFGLAAAAYVAWRRSQAPAAAPLPSDDLARMRARSALGLDAATSPLIAPSQGGSASAPAKAMENALAATLFPPRTLQSYVASGQRPTSAFSWLTDRPQDPSAFNLNPMAAFAKPDSPVAPTPNTPIGAPVMGQPEVGALSTIPPPVTLPRPPSELAPGQIVKNLVFGFRRPENTYTSRTAAEYVKFLPNMNAPARPDAERASPTTRLVLGSNGRPLTFIGGNPC